ncbi:hypothetical protein, partial [Salmonella sp. s51090]|uniref:hypothetical protein n=1 Tax=Salmonella sp. s51090 TaxID=3159651 RepID=UPI00397FF4AB
MVQQPQQQQQQQQMPHGPGGMQAQPPRGGYKYQGGAEQAIPQGMHMSGQDLLNPSALAAASQHDQKQMLGERLFPLIQNTIPDLAGKITGMLLEIDNAELL